MTELGSRLKEAREAKGLSLEDVQEITKIQKRYLQGIEEGNYSVMPGKFYVRAFIKQYAEAVNLNSDELFSEYANDVPKTEPDDYQQPLSRVKTNSQVSEKGSKLMEFFPMFLVIFFVILAIVVAYYFIQKAMNTTNSSEVPDEPQEQVIIEETSDPIIEEDEPEEQSEPIETEETPSSEPEEDSQPQSVLAVKETSGTSTTYTLSNSDDFTVELEAAPGGESWITMTDSNGERVYYNFVKDTQVESFDLNEATSVTIKVGSAPNTIIRVNGQELQYEIDPSSSNGITQEIIIEKLEQESTEE
ncbi:hypothetical protein Q73_06110 [Bacillus coahuilensis m2-6]|uniref:helix-turn-helix domain-containing protein n=1 Tax=Bacillus coahuilensis TaxID=408580 RepID=UPI0007505BB2|nr:RodZ family helix-turn-helix domain-containing protein [Bacillus coahuilensis]KUP08320.1 hypothetical protein Q73_06110 [Bacillus coahuilensis m2-6]